jgi:alkylhydroperoxidase family enzyme
MARLPYLSHSDLAESDHDLISSGFNLQRLLVHSPGGARAFGRLGHYLRNKSELNPRLRELAILQVGYVARASYEYAHHIEIGMAAGVSEADIFAMEKETSGESGGLDEVSTAVLRLARAMAEDRPLDEPTFQLLESALGRPNLIDLVIGIAIYCGVVRKLRVFEIDLEAAYEKYLSKYPLPILETTV